MDQRRQRNVQPPKYNQEKVEMFFLGKQRKEEEEETHVTQEDMEALIAS